MKTVHFGSSAVAVAAVVVVAGTAAAQDRSAAILNSLEVRQLVARAERADNVRLSAHFTALASRYAAEAKRHTSMSQSFVGNPSRNLGTGMSAHCKQLADLNTQSEAALRELASYHEKLAAGAPATLPRDGARFHGGAGAPEPSDNELSALAARATAPAEHRALEEYFLALATRYTTEANEHVALAQAFRGTRIPQVSVHHDRFGARARDAANEAAAAAEMHKRLATVSR